jgi:hypothetical protein
MHRALLTFLALGLAPTNGAGAEVPRTVQLDYERQEGAAGCPDDVAIRIGVAARLGYDPFREKSDDRLRATVHQVGHVLEARIELADAQGHVRARRRLLSRNRDCAELAAAVELAIVLAIDPMVSAQRPSDEAAATVTAVEAPDDVAPAVVASDVAPATSSSPKPVRSAIATRLDLGVLGGVGFAPSVNLGVRVGAALQGTLVSLGLDARADLPAAQPAGGGRVSAALLAASLVPCAHVGMASGCFLVTMGAQRVAGEDLDHARRATLPYLGLGIRLGLALPIGSRTYLALHGDVTAPITEARLKVDDSVVWTSPTLAAALGAGLALRFP